MTLRRVALLAPLVLIGSKAAAVCRLDRIEWIKSSDWGSCAQGDLGLYGIGISDGSSKRTGGVGWAEGYASAFFRPWLSVHGKAYALVNHQVRDEDQTAWQRTTEQAFLQLGHPLIGFAHAAVGRLPLPFGINDEAYRHALDSRASKFWDRSLTGLRLSLRIREDVRAEAGGNWSDASNLGRDSISFRLTKFVDLLSGTKLIASYQGRADYSTHKMGLGTLVYNEENVTSLEWVRISAREEVGSFEQVFRFIHRQVARPWAWDLSYEDIRKDSYRLSLGIQKHIEALPIDSLTVGASFHYERLRDIKAIHQTFFLFGASYGWATSFIGGTSDAQP